MSPGCIDDRESGPPANADDDWMDESEAAEEAHSLPIEEQIDLHAFSPRDVPEVVRSYLEAAAERGFREVRLIHGRGIGFQRERVREVLADHPRVESFEDAPPDRGHWGATLVRLRSGAETHD
jgi:DNA-nicking Smr family endonuclease